MKTLIITLATMGIACCVAGIVTVKMLPIGIFQERPPGQIHSQHAPKFIDTVHLERATTYQATESQCDPDPFTTADGSKINPNDYQNWVALSRDLLSRWGGPFNYGDTLDIYSKDHPKLNEEWVVHDCMAPRYKMSIDFLLEPEKNYPKLGVGKDVKIIYCPSPLQ